MHQLYDWFGLNIALFHVINGMHAAGWDTFMRTMTWLGDHSRYPYYMGGALLLAFLQPHVLPQRNVVVLGIGYVLTTVVVITLKLYFDFPRPLLALGTQAVVVVGKPQLHHSFPSRHAIFSVLVAASLSRHAAAPLRWGVWLFVALVCLSRVSVGAHFPADVVGGGLISLAVVATISVLLPVRKGAGRPS